MPDIVGSVAPSADDNSGGRIAGVLYERGRDAAGTDGAEPRGVADREEGRSFRVVWSNPYRADADRLALQQVAMETIKSGFENFIVIDTGGLWLSNSKSPARHGEKRKGLVRKIHTLEARNPPPSRTRGWPRSKRRRSRQQVQSSTCLGRTGSWCVKMFDAGFSPSGGDPSAGSSSTSRIAGAPACLKPAPAGRRSGARSRRWNAPGPPARVRRRRPPPAGRGGGTWARCAGSSALAGGRGAEGRARRSRS